MGSTELENGGGTDAAPAPRGEGRQERTYFLFAVMKNVKGQVVVHLEHENKGQFKQNYFENIAISNSLSSCIKMA